MYELGMSAEGACYPDFDMVIEISEDQIPQTGESITPTPTDPDLFFLEEEQVVDIGAVVIRSSIVVAFALALLGGLQFYQGSKIGDQIVIDKARYGEPYAAASGQSLSPRSIDLTTTGSIYGKPKVVETKYVPEPISPSFHVVVAGDTLSEIGRKYQVSAKKIMVLNDIDNPRRIRPGMKLVVTN